MHSSESSPGFVTPDSRRSWAGVRTVASLGATVVALSLGACSSGGSTSPASSSSSTSSVSPTKKVDLPIQIASDVAENGRLSLAQPITVSAQGAKVVDVQVTDANGKKVTGSFDAKNSSWTPTTILNKGASYTVTATANTADGTSTKKRSLRTTSNGATTTGIYIVEPWKQKTVGNAQPVVVTFSQPVPVSARKAIQDRLKVTDTSHVEGAWKWLSATRLDYRPKDFWPVGDKVTLSGNITGMKVGQTWAAGNLDDSFTVDSDLQAIYDPVKRVVTVSRGGKVVRTMLASGGKPGLETVSGSMVVLSKSAAVRMRSCSVGLGCDPSSPNYYDQTVNYAVQITPSGTYLHAAPWDQNLGRIDSSHGCIHLSSEDAKWFFDQVKPGNYVKVLGNANPVDITNGDGDWNLTWEQWTAAS